LGREKKVVIIAGMASRGRYISVRKGEGGREGTLSGTTWPRGTHLTGGKGNVRGKEGKVTCARGPKKTIQTSW